MVLRYYFCLVHRYATQAPVRELRFGMQGHKQAQTRKSNWDPFPRIADLAARLVTLAHEDRLQCDWGSAAGQSRNTDTLHTEKATSKTQTRHTADNIINPSKMVLRSPVYRMSVPTSSDTGGFIPACRNAQSAEGGWRKGTTKGMGANIIHTLCIVANIVANIVIGTVITSTTDTSGIVIGVVTSTVIGNAINVVIGIVITITTESTSISIVIGVVIGASSRGFFVPRRGGPEALEAG